MNTISVKLTITDDELYDNFIEPRKVNGELPTLVLRLLTVYASNDELACEIDQFFDQKEDPDACEARSAIMAAIARLNSADARAAQQVEALGGVDDTSDIDLVTDEDGLSEATTFNPTELPEAWLGSAKGIQDEPIITSTPVQSPVVNLPSPSSASESSDVMSYLNNLTAQISNLTAVVSQAVSAMTNQPVAPLIQPVAPQEQIIPAQNVGITSNSEKKEEQESSIVPNADGNSLQSQEVVSDISDEDAGTDEFEVPDFMDAMLAGLT